MSFEELASIVKEAEVASALDLGRAIGMLEGLREEEAFWPWGAFALMRLYMRDNQTAKASAIAGRLADDFSEFLPAFGRRLRLLRGSEDYFSEVLRMYAVLSSADRLPGWLRRDFLEIVMGAAADDFADIVERGLRDGVLEPAHVMGMRRLVPVIIGVKAFMEARERYPAPNGHTPSGWSFSFLDTDAACVEINNVIYVNLSPLILSEIEGWERDLAAAFAISVCGLMKWAPYIVDDGVLSWPSVKSDAAYAAILHPLLHSHARRLSPKVLRYSDRTQATFAPGELWVRPGNVELWALWNYLIDAEGACAAAEEVAELMPTADDAAVEGAVRESWWPRTHARNNIIRLNASAGWYAKPGLGRASFADWAQRYLAALTEGSLLTAHTGDLLRIMPLAPGLRGKQRHAWNDAALISALDGADVVFVSAFADQVARHYRSGGLHALWRELGLGARVRSLEAVQAPISIWPSYPNDSWSESFQALCAETDRVIRESGSSVLVASCGAYGLPLVHEMHRRFGILCIYFGHATNLYFGIYTNAFANHPLYLRNPASSEWVKGDAGSRNATLARVDRGRYVVDTKSRGDAEWVRSGGGDPSLR